jgi:hypothetical protein
MTAVRGTAAHIGDEAGNAVDVRKRVSKEQEPHNGA